MAVSVTWIVVFVCVVISSVIIAYFKIRRAVAKDSAKSELLSKLEKLADDMIDQHKATLAVKFNQSLAVDEYDRLDRSIWLRQLQYFVEDVFATEAAQVIKNSTYRTIASDSEIEAFVDAMMFDGGFGKSVASRAHDAARLYEAKFDADIDGANIDPYEFEEKCAGILRSSGWDARATKKSGDQGVDVIASKIVDDVKHVLVVQCKLYSQPVGNSAVQEIFAAKTHEGAHYAAVVSNQGYTKSAKQLASTTGVVLLHYTDLHQIDDFILESP